MNENMSANEKKPGIRFITPWGYTHMDCFDPSLIGRALTFETVNNRTYTWKLTHIGQFDLIMDNRTGQSILLFNYSIVSVLGEMISKR